MPTLTSSCDGNILCFKRIKNEGGEGVSGGRGVRVLAQVSLISIWMSAQRLLTSNGRDQAILILHEEVYFPKFLFKDVFFCKKSINLM